MRNLVIGGAGFIGSNLVSALLKGNEEVIVFDNLSRKGSKKNLDWLRSKGEFEFVKGDVRNYDVIKNLFKNGKNIDVVFHMAAQVAVTTSVVNPREDFEINALGTLNLLEAVREAEKDPIILFASTNKVYGKLGGVAVAEKANRYELEKMVNGISEREPLDFYSPYGCSKGCADQYVLDYARIYGLRTVVFRKSCIYGYRQFGVEDQGWLAWFTIAAALGKQITIYGNGKQVRDVLFIDDLVRAYLSARDNIDKIVGRAYNVGGGIGNQLSLLELLELLSKLFGKHIDVEFSDWRPGDQPVYISDISKIKKEMGWVPEIGVEDGVNRLCKWVSSNKELFKHHL